MKKPITQKKIEMMEKFWNNCTYHDRILTLNTLSIVGESAKEYADMMWLALPEDVCAKLLGAAR